MVTAKNLWIKDDPQARGGTEDPRRRPRLRLQAEAGDLRLCNQPGLIPIRGGIFSGLSCVGLSVTGENPIFQEAREEDSAAVHLCFFFAAFASFAVLLFFFLALFASSAVKLPSSRRS